jgi:membrane protein implicated in regulation of membrane protease activity
VIPVDLAQTIYIGCVLIGGGLLLVTVVLDDLLGGLLDFLNVDLDLGGVSLMPLLLSFISMFGVGGLIGIHILGLTGGQSAVVGGVAGVVGAGVAYTLFSFLRRAEAPEAFSLADLVGSTARVSVSIPARRYGSVLLSYAGSSHNLTATAEVDVPAGVTVTVTGIAGSSLIVEPAATAAAGGIPDA